MAPEMDGNTLYGPEVDIWSLGIMFFSLLVGKHSQVDSTKEETYRPIKQENLSPLYPNNLHISIATQSLINKMLKKDPWLRSSLKDIECSLNQSVETNYKSASTTNRTMSDSGVASSCTSGSTGANGSGTGMFRHFNSYNQDRNILNGALKSVAEENSVMDSALENCRYMNPMTPRTNFVRSSNNERVTSNNTPLRPNYTSSPYAQADGAHLNYSPISSIKPQSQHIVNSGNVARNMHSTTTVESSYRSGDIGLSKPAPLTTLRLRPSTKEHKTKKATYCILQNGDVKMELNIEKRARQNGEPSIIAVKETMIISSDGRTIVVQRNGGSQGETTYSYDDLPKKYWVKYRKAAEVVNNFKATTPKITWTTNKAICKLMENGNLSESHVEANFEVEFQCGMKFEFDAAKNIISVSEKIESKIRNESRCTFRLREKIDSHKLDLLNSNYGHLSQLFQKYRDRIKEIDKHFEELQTKDLNTFNASELGYFPLRLGPNKLQSSSSASMVFPRNHSNTNTGCGNENKLMYANQKHAFSTGELRGTPSIEQRHAPTIHRYGSSQ